MAEPFNEDSLERAIFETWGEYGAHAEVWQHVRKLTPPAVEQIGYLCLQGHPHRICSGCTSACIEPVFAYPQQGTGQMAETRAGWLTVGEHTNSHSTR